MTSCLFFLLAAATSSTTASSDDSDDICPVVVERAVGADSPSASPLRSLMEAVRAPGGSIEDPCEEASDSAGGCTCARTTMEPFYASLQATASSGRRTAVLALGNSLIASDGITDVVRARLAERFGDGGRGLVLADRMASYGPRSRTAKSASGWKPETCALDLHNVAPFGVPGVNHVSTGPANSSFSLNGERDVTLYWVEREGGPPLSWRVDGGAWQPLAARGNGARFSKLEVGPRARELQLRAAGAGAVVQGVSLERGGGIVLDTCGVPSADASLWLRTDEELFAMQLADRAPSLVMLMLGGNEVKRINWGRSTAESIEFDLRALVRRVKAASDAACLVIGPIDAVVGRDAKNPWQQRDHLEEVIALQRLAAHEEGCAFFDLYGAMGGRGSLARLHERGAVHDDLVHPRGKGLDMLGQLIVDALLLGYAQSSPPPVHWHASATTVPSSP